MAYCMAFCMATNRKQNPHAVINDKKQMLPPQENKLLGMQKIWLCQQVLRSIQATQHKNILKPISKKTIDNVPTRKQTNKLNKVSLMANLAWWNARSEGLRESPCRSSDLSLVSRTRNNWKSLRAFPNERTLTIPMELGLLDFLKRSSMVNRRLSGSCESPSPSQSEDSMSFPFMNSEQPRALRRSCLDRLTSDTNHKSYRQKEKNQWQQNKTEN